MIQLGLTGSLKMNDTAVVGSKDNNSNYSSENENKAVDFAKALGGKHGADYSGLETAEGRPRGEYQNDIAFEKGNVLERVDVESNLTDGLVKSTDKPEIFKNIFDMNAKQIAFVTIDGALAEKLAPVKVNASNYNAADSARNTANISAEKLGQSVLPMVTADKDKPSASKVFNQAQEQSSLVAKGNDKSAAEKFVAQDNKTKNELQNRAPKSIMDNPTDDGAENGKTVGKTVGRNAAITNGSIRFNINGGAKENGALNAEMTTKVSNEKINAELVSERVVEKFKNSKPSDLHFRTAQVSVKSSNTAVNFLTESKVENLGSTLQQIVTTSESKTGEQVRTVSAPRIVLPGSQSVVSQKTIEIQLLPKSLGLIQVKIEILDGKMNLTIEAQTAKAEAAIKQEIVQIVETIKAAGMSVEEISVRRNAELSQQDQAINEFSSDANLQENFANGEFGEQFEDPKNGENAGNLEDANSENDTNGGRNNTRTGIYL